MISRLPSTSGRSTNTQQTPSHAHRIPWLFKRTCGRGWSLCRPTCTELCIITGSVACRRGPDNAVADSRHWYVALVCGYGGWPPSVLNCTERWWPHHMGSILHLDMYLNSIRFMSQFRHESEEPLNLIMFCGSMQPVRQAASCVRCPNVQHFIVLHRDTQSVPPSVCAAFCTRNHATHIPTPTMNLYRLYRD